MPEQYTINGTITLTNGAERGGLSVRAFDRDLPSLERRTGSERQPLGKASTDAAGNFQILYTLEQFQRGEGITSFRRVRQQNADLSFQVFDGAGHELNIISIEAGDQSYRSDQIIFKAPASLEVVIFADTPRESGASEYERLFSLIAPAIEDVALMDLTADDLAFITNELGLEQERDVQQRLEWLKRSALLAHETNLPVESFYGWGRRDVPARFIELAVLPVDDMASTQS